MTKPPLLPPTGKGGAKLATKAGLPGRAHEQDLLRKATAQRKHSVSGSVHSETRGREGFKSKEEMLLALEL